MADVESGGLMSMEFSEKSIRHAFIRKVYAILSLQLLITFGIASIFVFSETVRQFSQANPALVYTAMGLSLALVIVLACCPDVRRATPQNYIILFVFTACEGYLIGAVCATYDVSDVMKAVATTIVIVLALTLFAFQTKIDFTMISGIMFVVLLGFLVFGIMVAIFPSEVMKTLYAALGAILFSVYIVVDTQLMMGGHHKLAISPEEYVFAALNLYLDVINLFLFILALFGGGRN